MYGNKAVYSAERYCLLITCGIAETLLDFSQAGLGILQVVAKLRGSKVAISDISDCDSDCVGWKLTVST